MGTGNDDLKDRVLGLGEPRAGDAIRTRDPLLGKHWRLLHAWIGAKTLVSTPCLWILPESDHQSGKLSSPELSANAILDLCAG